MLTVQERKSSPQAAGAWENQRRPVLLLLAAFAIFGAMFGCWQVLLADLSQALHLSPGPLGTALSAGFITSLPALLLGGQVVDRWGARLTIVASGTVLALVLAGVAVIGRYWQLVLLLLVFFAATGIYDVAINTAALPIERLTGRPILPYLHAAFSGGAAAGAILTGALRAGGIPFQALYVGAATLLGALVVLFLCFPLERDAQSRQRQPESVGRLRWSLALTLLTTITTLSFFAEGTLETWSSIYLRSSLALPVLLGAAGPATFHLAMTTGRLATAGALLRMPRLTLLWIAGLVAAGGMLVALATTMPTLILVGLLFVGLAFSGIVPVALSLVGVHARGHDGQATSRVMSIAYSGFLVGPILIGGLAERASLRVALGVVILAGVLVTTCSLLVGRSAPAEPALS